MTLGALSYLIAALAFGAAAWRVPVGIPLRRAPRIRLAMVACFAWSVLLAVHGSHTSIAEDVEPLVIPAEVLFFGAVLLLLDTLNDLPAGHWLRQLNLWAWIAALVLSVAAVVDPRLLGLSSLIGLTMSLICLANLEQLLRNAPPAAARAIKFCVVGFGGQVAYNLFLYSQAQLLGGFDAQAWALRGVVFAGLLALASIGLRRLAQENPTLFVSRQVVFYSTALLSVGIYLVVMAVGGYYVRVHGGTWGEQLRLMFFVGAGVVLAMLMLSPSLWRRWRVFVAKHFFRNKYDYRVEWLRFIDTLSATDPVDARVTAIRAIAQILESPEGLLLLRDADGRRFEFTASWSRDGASRRVAAAVDAEDDLPRFLADRQWVIDLEEFRRQPALYRNIGLPDWLLDPASRWRIVAPLLELDRLIGLLVLRSPPAPFQMTFEDRDLLRTVGRHVATLLAQQAADRKLAESRQFDAFHRFAAFVMHDLKNSVAQLQLLVTNAARHRGNPEFLDDAIETIGNTAARMTRLIEQLQSREAATAAAPVGLAPLLAALSRRCGSRPPGLHMEPPGSSAEPVNVMADSERLLAVLEHVVRNAQEAAGGQGEVRVGLSSENGWALISVRDNGPGMDAEFVRDRLFRPFDSTKGPSGMGIGAYQTREYVRQLGGAVEVQSSPGEGTAFLIRLPLCQNPNPAS